MNTKILGRLLAMSEAEIYGMIQPRTINDIKREDPTPKLLAFIIGQEGESTPTLQGLGSVIVRWFKSAIEAITTKLSLGAPVFHGHASTGSAQNRTPIGEVVGKLTKRIGDAMSSIAAVYIYPAFRDIPYDVASIEFVVRVPDNSREFEVEEADVQAITGIALGNSAVDKPAFPGATLLAQLQAFAETNRQQGGETKMTLEEVRKAIQEGKFLPSDLFSAAQLTSDPSIKEHVEEKVNNAKGYDIRKRQDLEKKVDDLTTENTTLKAKVTEATAGTLKVKAKDTFGSVLNERAKVKEDDRYVKFLRKQFDEHFKPGEEAKLKDDLNKFFDTKIDELKDVIGEPVKSKTKPDGGAPAQKTGGAPAAGKEADDDDSGNGGEANPLFDPKNNDLIPKD